MATSTASELVADVTSERARLTELAGPQGNRHQGPPTKARVAKLEHIKNVAATLFFSDGYAAMDIRSIAEALNMHPSTLYNYISGKEGLLYLIIADGLAAIHTSLDQAIASSEDPTEQLRAALRSHLLHHLQRQHLAWVGHVEFRALTGEFLAEVRRQRHSYEAKWVALVESGIEAGAFEVRDAHVTTFGLLAAGQGASRWYNPKGGLTPDEVCETLVPMALGGVLVRG